MGIVLILQRGFYAAGLFNPCFAAMQRIIDLTR